MDINPAIFREYDIRGRVDSDFSNDILVALGRAAGTFFRQNACQSVVLGWDARLSSPVLADFLGRGFLAAGLEVVELGAVPTPALYYAVDALEADAGAMITGSHNPPEYNGIKLQRGPDPVFGRDIRRIYELLVRGEFESGEGRRRRHEGILERYREFLRSRLRTVDRRLRVVVDSGNGMGGLVAPDLYRELGVEVVSLYGEPDGRFPHHHPDPTVEENLRDLRKLVVEEGADLGLAFDGDADRVGAVEEKGGILWGDDLLTLFARQVLAEHPGATIIGDVKCSDRFFADVEGRGGKVLWNRTGHSLLKARLREEKALLAGEWSGHFCFADRFPGFDDGIYAGGRLLEITAAGKEPLSRRLRDLPQMISLPEIRVECSDEKKFAVVERVKQRLSRCYDTITLDGVRVRFPDGWALVRASNTQPALVLRYEARDRLSLEQIRREVETVLEESLIG